MNAAPREKEMAQAIIRCFEADLGGFYCANIVAVMNHLDDTLAKTGGEIQGRLGDIACAINNLAAVIREVKQP
jgi:hypothetical protein